MEAKAFIFDLDGVLTDTARYHFLAWHELAKELGLSFTEKDNERLKGVSRVRSFEIILEVNGKQDDFTEQEKSYYASKKNDRYVRLIQQITPKDVLPNILPFLSEAKTAGTRLAVASASKNAERVMELLGIRDCFDYLADAAKISHAKPDPEVFLVCADALGLLPENCIGFEDAQAGIEAIHAAKMFSVGIHVDVTSVPPDLALSSTNELNFERIVRAFQEGVKHGI